MEHFVPALLTPGKRFALGEDEVEYCTVAGVQILNEHKAKVRRNCLVLLTSHNVFCADMDTLTNPSKLPLLHVSRYYLHASIFRMTPRVDVFVGSGGPSESETASLRFAMARDRASDFAELLGTTLRRKAWEATAAAAAPAKEEEGFFSSRNAGISGVMRRQENERNRNKSLATEAFADLDALMGKARNVVDMVGRYSATIENAKDKQHTDNAAASSSNSPNQVDENEFNSLLHNMGIANPVTKKAAGSMYHRQLAREICDFLTNTLPSHKKSHILTLTDLYALINRARGTELISPNDLLEAANLFDDLELGFRTKQYASGVIVVQPVGLTQEGVEEKLRALAATHRHDGVTVSTAAQELLVSVPVALEMLTAADASGAICRDEDPVAGLRFYSNLFLDHQLSSLPREVAV